MKLKLLRASYLVLMMAIFTSCATDDDNNNFTYEIVFVDEVSAQSSTTAGTPIIVEVKFTVNNGCGGFERFIESNDGFTRNIAVEASYVGGICTTALQTITVDYLFESETVGRHTLNFRSSPTEFISVVINVN